MNVIKFSFKTIYSAAALCCLIVVSLPSYATFIFQFDNTEIPEINFVGVEASGIHLYFGPNKLDIGDSFDLLIGATPGTSELASALGMSFDVDDIGGFGFGDTLNLTPLTEQFFVTIIINSGSFNVSGVTAYFIDNGEGANFSGIAQRPDETIDVSEPKPILLLFFSLGFMWSLVRTNNHHNA